MSWLFLLLVSSANLFYSLLVAYRARQLAARARSLDERRASLESQNFSETLGLATGQQLLDELGCRFEPPHILIRIEHGGYTCRIVQLPKPAASAILSELGKRVCGES